MRYLRIYRQLILANWRVFCTYRADAISSIIASLAWGAFSMIAVALVTRATSSVAGWTPAELLLMTATYAIVVGGFHVLFSHSFSRFATVIYKGELDGYLVKPVVTHWLLATQSVKFTSLVRVVLACGIGGWIIAANQLQISILSVGAFFLSVVISTILLYGIHLGFIVLLLRNPEVNNLLELAGVMMGTARYPVDMLWKRNPIILVLFLPILMVVSIPTKILLMKATLWEVALFVLLTLSICGFSLFAWKQQLKAYTGAGT